MRDKRSITNEPKSTPFDETADLRPIRKFPLDENMATNQIKPIRRQQWANPSIYIYRRGPTTTKEDTAPTPVQQDAIITGREGEMIGKINTTFRCWEHTKINKEHLDKNLGPTIVE